MPRVDDIFRRGRDHSEPICTCSKLLTIRQFALPNNDAFAVIDYKDGCISINAWNTLCTGQTIFFAVVETILNLFALARSCSRFDSSLCPKAMLSPWWITGLAYIYQCLKHALLRVGDIFHRGNSYRSPETSITRKFWDFGSKLSYEIPKEAASVRSHLRKISKKEKE